MLIAVPVILLVLAVAGQYIARLTGLFPQAKVAGIRFFFVNEALESTLDPDYVRRFVRLYCEWMPKVYQSLGQQVTTEDLKAHISSLSCLVTEVCGEDGPRGITLDDSQIEVPVTTTFKDSPFAYEVHRSCVWHLTGHGPETEALVAYRKLDSKQIETLNKSFMDVNASVKE